MSSQQVPRNQFVRALSTFKIVCNISFVIFPVTSTISNIIESVMENITTTQMPNRECACLL